jgi:hypothetical protein
MSDSAILFAMLTIRPEQMAVFRTMAGMQFRDYLLDQLSVAYPAHFDALGEPGVRDLIEFAISTGKTHGIENRGEVAVLCELMLRFGRNFELSPDRAWARKILAKPAIPGDLKVSILSERMESTTGGRIILPVKKT